VPLEQEERGLGGGERAVEGNTIFCKLPDAARYRLYIQATQIRKCCKPAGGGLSEHEIKIVIINIVLNYTVLCFIK
jgi:hypothetical protein